jgi:hypothetical protein
MRIRSILLIVGVLSLPALARGQCGTASYYRQQTISYQSAPQLTYAAAPTPAPCACIPSVPASAPMTYASYQQADSTVDVAALLSLLRSYQTTSYQQTAAIPYAPTYAPSYQTSYSVASAPIYLPSYRTSYTRDVFPIHRDYDFRRDFVPVGHGQGYFAGGNAFAKSIPIPYRPQLLPVPSGFSQSFAPQPSSIFGNLRGRTAAGAGAGGLLGAAEGLTGLGDGSGQFLQGALIARFLPGGGGFRFKR